MFFIIILFDNIVERSNDRKFRLLFFNCMDYGIEWVGFLKEIS